MDLCGNEPSFQPAEFVECIDGVCGRRWCCFPRHPWISALMCARLLGTALAELSACLRVTASLAAPVRSPRMPRGSVRMLKRYRITLMNSVQSEQSVDNDQSRANPQIEALPVVGLSPL